jgi:hypothetical protein
LIEATGYHAAVPGATLTQPELAENFTRHEKEDAIALLAK